MTKKWLRKGKEKIFDFRKVYHNPDRSDWHFCEICAKPFPYINDLKVHVTRCAAGKSKAFSKLRLVFFRLFICIVLEKHLTSTFEIQLVSQRALSLRRRHQRLTLVRSERMVYLICTTPNQCDHHRRQYFMGRSLWDKWYIQMVPIVLFKLSETS